MAVQVRRGPGDMPLPSRLHWRWVILPGVLAGAGALSLWAVLVGGYGFASHLLGGGEEGWARVTDFGANGRWAVPLNAMVLTGLGANRVARRVAERPERHGLLIGGVAALTTFLGLLAIHGDARPLTVVGAFAVLGAGWFGGWEARSAAATLRALYEAGQAVARARTPQDIIDTLGRSLEQDRVVYVGIWETGQPGHGDSWGSTPSPVQASAEWWASDRPAGLPASWLADVGVALTTASPAATGPTVLCATTPGVSHSDTWRSDEPRSALLIPVPPWSGDRAAVLVGSASTFVFDRHRLAVYRPLTDQISAAIEHVRLLEQGRQVGVWGERQRLARDIHDAVKQQVFAAELQVAAARALVETDPVKADQRLDEAASLIQRVQTELAGVIHELQFSPPERHPDLADRIRRLADDWSHRSGIPVSVDIRHASTLPARHADVILRVTEEALANAARHSDATGVTVTLHSSGATLTLTVSDNGRGIDPAIVRRSGFGLTSMRERVTQLDGTVAIDSEPGKGVRITCQLPLVPTNTANDWRTE